MKSLKQFIKEEIGLGGVYATPATTLGMGSVNFPTETQPGSGDVPNAGFVKPKRRKKFKRYKI